MNFYRTSRRRVVSAFGLSRSPVAPIAQCRVSATADRGSPNLTVRKQSEAVIHRRCIWLKRATSAVAA
jgi:hypothetical protein